MSKEIEENNVDIFGRVYTRPNWEYLAQVEAYFETIGKNKYDTYGYYQNCLIWEDKNLCVETVNYKYYLYKEYKHESNDFGAKWVRPLGEAKQLITLEECIELFGEIADTTKYYNKLIEINRRYEYSSFYYELSGYDEDNWHSHMLKFYMELSKAYSVELQCYKNTCICEVNGDKEEFNTYSDNPIIESHIKFFFKHRELFSKIIKIKNGYVYNDEFYPDEDNVIYQLLEDVTKE